MTKVISKELTMEQGIDYLFTCMARKSVNVVSGTITSGIQETATINNTSFVGTRRSRSTRNQISAPTTSTISVSLPLLVNSTVIHEMENDDDDVEVFDYDYTNEDLLAEVRTLLLTLCIVLLLFILYVLHISFFYRKFVMPFQRQNWVILLLHIQDY